MKAGDLPGRRRALRGTDLDGNTVWLQFSISQKLYRCPGCRGFVEVGAEHVLVRIATPQEEPYHQHWHTDCARTVSRGLRSVVEVEPEPRPARRRRR